MRERPILFNGAMVRAILGGRKTQTRRAMRVQPVRKGPFWEAFGAGWSEGMSSVPAVAGHSLAANCPFGQPGDRIWVRETFAPIYSSVDGSLIEVDYRATYEHGDRMGDHLGIKKEWKPSIHMPREACRLVLEVTDVRVERLQAISESDVFSEGLERLEKHDRDMRPTGQYRALNQWLGKGEPDVWDRPAEAFRCLWDSTGGDWSANPWVWVVGFRPVDGDANG